MCKCIHEGCKTRANFNIDKVYQNLPYIDLCFTDTELYEYFRLTSEEILLVEKVF